MVPQPRRSEGADRTLAAVLQRAAAAQRPWLQTPGDRSPELVGTRYHSPRTHCLIGYKFHTQVTTTAYQPSRKATLTLPSSGVRSGRRVTRLPARRKGVEGKYNGLSPPSPSARARRVLA